LKDVPTTLPPGLVLAAIPKIDVPRGDVVIMKAKHAGCTLATLPEGSVIGTCSLRRQACFLYSFPDKQFNYKVIRGNMNTRLQKLEE
jgi:hydroxymethylbilane synthase